MILTRQPLLLVDYYNRRIMKLITGEDVSQQKNHILLIGKPKKGKTHFIGTMSDHEKVFIVSLEKGLAPIKGKKFTGVEVSNFKEFQEAVEYFMKSYKKEGYTCLAIDSITRMQSYLISELNGGKVKEKLTFDKYAEMLATMRKMLDALTKAQDFCVVIVAHEREADDMKASSNGPLLDGAIQYEIGGYFDTVLVAENGLDKDGKIKYWLKVQGNERCIAGTRLQHLKGKSVIPCDYKYLIETKE